MHFGMEEVVIPMKMGIQKIKRSGFPINEFGNDSGRQECPPLQ